MNSSRSVKLGLALLVALGMIAADFSPGFSQSNNSYQQQQVLRQQQEAAQRARQAQDASRHAREQQQLRQQQNVQQQKIQQQKVQQLQNAAQSSGQAQKAAKSAQIQQQGKIKSQAQNPKQLNIDKNKLKNLEKKIVNTNLKSSGSGSGGPPDQRLTPEFNKKAVQKGGPAAKSVNLSKEAQGKLKELTKKVSGQKQGSKDVDKWSRSPKSIQDQMAFEAAKKGAGKKLDIKLADPKYKGMEKWQYTAKSVNGKTSVIHYVRDPKTGKLMDFKFKKHSTD